MYCAYTRNVEAFFKRTVIEYRPNPSKKDRILVASYAIVVFFKNSTTPRVLYFFLSKAVLGGGRLRGNVLAAAKVPRQDSARDLIKLDVKSRASAPVSAQTLIAPAFPRRLCQWKCADTGVKCLPTCCVPNIAPTLAANGPMPINQHISFNPSKYSNAVGLKAVSHTNCKR